jgi:hypothetical protein
MRFPRAVWPAVAIGVLAAGCDGDHAAYQSPTSPLELEQASSAVVLTANWIGEVVSSKASGTCSKAEAAEPVRRSANWFVRFGADHIRLIPDMGNYPTDNLDYYGALQGNRFSASVHTRPPYAGCQLRVARMTGTLSPDRRALAADELLIFGKPGRERRLERHWRVSRAR